MASIIFWLAIGIAVTIIGIYLYFTRAAGADKAIGWIAGKRRATKHADTCDADIAWTDQQVRRAIDGR